MVRELLKRGASVDLQSSLGRTALKEAAYGGHLSVLFVLLQQSASIDEQDHNGGTALIKAAYTKGKRRACRPCCEPKLRPLAARR